MGFVYTFRQRMGRIIHFQEKTFKLLTLKVTLQIRLEQEGGYLRLSY